MDARRARWVSVAVAAFVVLAASVPWLVSWYQDQPTASELALTDQADQFLELVDAGRYEEAVAVAGTCDTGPSVATLESSFGRRPINYEVRDVSVADVRGSVAASLRGGRIHTLSLIYQQTAGTDVWELCQISHGSYS